jgi:hypothetical protein
MPEVQWASSRVIGKPWSGPHSSPRERRVRFLSLDSGAVLVEGHDSIQVRVVAGDLGQVGLYDL